MAPALPFTWLLAAFVVSLVLVGILVAAFAGRGGKEE